MFFKKLKKLLFTFILALTSISSLVSCGEIEDDVEPEDPGTQQEEIKHNDTQLCLYCKKCIDTNCTCLDKCNCEPLVVTKETFVLYEDTIWETPGYLFKTNKEGPGIVIVGGIHGDEVAGWTAASELVLQIEKEKKLCGNILIVPQVNILADQRKERYVGKILGQSANKPQIVIINGVSDSYTDLNRSFEYGRDSNSTSRTIWLSDQIVKMISDFDKEYGADYIIDLHEAKKSWIDSNSTQLGDTLIYSNKALLCRKILSNYNKNYRLSGEVNFGSEVAAQEGSFSYNFTKRYPDSVVFTIETNRDFLFTTSSTGYDQISLDIRVRQQLNMLKAMFDIAWERI